MHIETRVESNSKSREQKSNFQRINWTVLYSYVQSSKAINLRCKERPSIIFGLWTWELKLSRKKKGNYYVLINDVLGPKALKRIGEKGKIQEQEMISLVVPLLLSFHCLKSILLQLLQLCFGYFKF